MADEDLEGQKPYDVGYDESEMSDSDVSRSDFEFSPEWARDKFSKLAFQRKQERQRADKEAGRAEAMAQQNAAMAARLAALEAKVGTDPAPKPGIEGVEDGHLREYKSRAYGWMQKAALDPTDETAKAEVAKIDFSKLSLVDEELARRAAEKPVSELRQQITQHEQAKSAQQTLTNRLRLKYGDEVLDMQSPLMTRAAAIAKEIAVEFGLEKLDAGASLLAVERAHAEMRRNNSQRREMSERDRQRLSLEVGARREAASVFPSPKGGWKAQVAQTEATLDKFLDGMGLPRD